MSEADFAIPPINAVHPPTKTISIITTPIKIFFIFCHGAQARRNTDGHQNARHGRHRGAEGDSPPYGRTARDHANGLCLRTDDLKQEEKAFQILLSGESEQKVAALDWLEAHHSWDAKRWVQGLLYDASPAVRIRAARYIADTHYLPFLPNLQAAYRTETDKATQEELKTQLEKLTALLP